jgi:hypothetical protein
MPCENATSQRFDVLSANTVNEVVTIARDSRLSAKHFILWLAPKLRSLYNSLRIRVVKLKSDAPTIFEVRQIYSSLFGTLGANKHRKASLARGLFDLPLLSDQSFAAGVCLDGKS